MTRRFIIHTTLSNSGILFYFPLSRELLHIMQFDAFHSGKTIQQRYYLKELRHDSVIIAKKYTSNLIELCCFLTTVTLMFRIMR